MKHVHFPLDSSYSSIALVLPIEIENNSGVAHVLEHLLLCGSKQFPFEDLFFTARANHIVHDMNAATYPDHITLHATAWNKNELESILSIYQSLIAEPLLKEADFKIEGVRRDIDGFSGVVFNEMLGEPYYDRNAALSGAYAQLFNDSRAYNANGVPSSLQHLEFESLQHFWKNNCFKKRAICLSAGPLFAEQNAPNFMDITSAPTPKSTTVTFKQERYHAWVIGEVAHPASYYDGWLIAHHYNKTMIDVIIDNRNADLILFSKLDRERIIDATLKLNDHDIESAHASFINPVSHQRPNPLMWLNRFAASYARCGGFVAMEDWLRTANERHSLWLDMGWRTERLNQIFALSSQDNTIKEEPLPKASKQKTEYEVKPPQLFRKEYVRVDNPFREISSAKFSDNSNTNSGNFQLAVEQKLFERPTLLSKLEQHDIDNANNAAFFIPITTNDCHQMANLHLLTAYWTISHLHPEIRRGKGAYGASARFSVNKKGIILFVYRDPNIAYSISYIEHLIRNTHSIQNKDQFILCQRFALGRLSPRNNGTIFSANNDEIRSLKDWETHKSAWQIINSLDMSTFNDRIDIKLKSVNLYAAVL